MTSVVMGGASALMMKKMKLIDINKAKELFRMYSADTMLNITQICNILDNVEEYDLPEEHESVETKKTIL